MTNDMHDRVLIDTATASSTGKNPAAARLYRDRTLHYTTELAVANTRWQTTEVPWQQHEEPQSVDLTLNAKGVLYAVVTYNRGAMAFAVLDRFPRWHFVNLP